MACVRLTGSVQLARAKDSDRDIEVPGEGHEAKDTTESGGRAKLPREGHSGTLLGAVLQVRTHQGSTLALSHSKGDRTQRPEPNT